MLFPLHIVSEQPDQELCSFEAEAGEVTFSGGKLKRDTASERDLKEEWD